MKKVTFTGSVDTGREIYKYLPPTRTTQLSFFSPLIAFFPFLSFLSFLLLVKQCRQAAEKLIPVTLELGGKSPMIGT